MVCIAFNNGHGSLQEKNIRQSGLVNNIGQEEFGCKVDNQPCFVIRVCIENLLVCP